MSRSHYHPSWDRPRLNVVKPRRSMETAEGLLSWLEERDGSTAGHSWKATLDGHPIGDEELRFRWLAEAVRR